MQMYSKLRTDPWKSPKELQMQKSLPLCAKARAKAKAAQATHKSVRTVARNTPPPSARTPPCQSTKDRASSAVSQATKDGNARIKAKVRAKEAKENEPMRSKKRSPMRKSQTPCA